ncbi:hypothetical protein DFJ74DRAFT_191134 [Hyaloraphidium curvatum]|nr:hypothetical protein DFJ74DRAFT_191134 [Hyaloraphidium curvatum]
MQSASEPRYSSFCLSWITPLGERRAKEVRRGLEKGGALRLVRDLDLDSNGQLYRVAESRKVHRRLIGHALGRFPRVMEMRVTSSSEDAVKAFAKTEFTLLQRLSLRDSLLAVLDAMDFPELPALTRISLSGNFSIHFLHRVEESCLEEAHLDFVVATLNTWRVFPQGSSKIPCTTLSWCSKGSDLPILIRSGHFRAREISFDPGTDFASAWPIMPELRSVHGLEAHSLQCQHGRPAWHTAAAQPSKADV